MKDHELRIVKELEELKEKLEKLTDFMYTDIYASLDAINQGLLMVQLEFMQGYLKTLSRRVELFK